MWRDTTKIAEPPPIEADRALDSLQPRDLRILRILDEAGAGKSLRHARRETDDLALMLIASGASTFIEFDQSLERLQAQGMISLDEHDFANLTEQGRDQVHPLSPPTQHADTRNRQMLAVA
jgi:hypothetical protein